MKTFALYLLGMLLPAVAAHAANTWIVTNLGEPATISSTNCVANDCYTLRDAINIAASGDTIVFTSEFAGQTIALSLYSNAQSGSEFGPSAFFITGNKTLTIDGETDLTGGGVTIARGASAAPFRLFDVDSGSTLILRGLTLKNGLAQGFNSDFGGGALGAGGAIFSQGTLTIDQCTFADNIARGGSSGDGSGNYSGAGVGSAPANGNGGGPNGSTVYGVGGGFGGGGIAYDGGSDGGFGGGGGAGGPGGYGGFGGGAGAASGGGSASGGFGGGNNNGQRLGGGGSGMGGAIFNDAGTLSITNSTFTANAAYGGNGGMAGGNSADKGSGFGGAIFNYSGSLSIVYGTLARNRVSAGTTGSGGTADGGAFYSLGDSECASGNNLCNIHGQATLGLESSIFSNSIDGAHDLVVTAINAGSTSVYFADGLIVMAYDPNQLSIGNYLGSADPLLSPLGYHGGWTPTLVPKQGSAAIDSIDCGTPSVDQRGVARPQGASCDLGAVEYDGDYIFANGFD